MRTLKLLLVASVFLVGSQSLADMKVRHFVEVTPGEVIGADLSEDAKKKEPSRVRIMDTLRAKSKYQLPCIAELDEILKKRIYTRESMKSFNKREAHAGAHTNGTSIEVVYRVREDVTFHKDYTSSSFFTPYSISATVSVSDSTNSTFRTSTTQEANSGFETVLNDNGVCDAEEIYRKILETGHVRFGQHVSSHDAVEYMEVNGVEIPPESQWRYQGEEAVTGR